MAEPLRLCVVTWQLAPDSGWGRYSLGLVRGLAERGVRMTVLTERRSEPPDGVAAERIVPCLSTPLAALDRPKAFAWNLAQVNRWSRGHDLVHFFVEPYALASSLAFVWPSVITVHGTYGVIPMKMNPVTRTFFGRAMNRAGSVVCVSRYTRDRVREVLPSARLDVITNGFEALNRSAVEDRESIEGSPVILGVGALKPRKGYHVTVEAVARLRKRFPGIHYYLVGDDQDVKYVTRLRDLVAELDLGRHVTITGTIPDARLEALYRRCDAFVLTPISSGTAFEGFGLAYLEANHYGKPVVGSTDCGAEDAIEDGVNGRLARPNDPDSVADCLTSVLEHPDLATAMGERGRERALARDWSTVAGEYLDVYRRVLAAS